MQLLVGARSSCLSRKQVEEVASYFPEWTLTPVYYETKGDLDQTTSLRLVEKTNFFTQEIDEALLRGEIGMAVHSAKDLPETLPEGLVVGCLTPSLSGLDALVLQEQGALFPSMLVATSSKQREQRVLQLVPDAKFVDVRGVIHERLAYLEKGVDGVVVAEAALLRLGLDKLPRVYLPGPSTPLQGSLALVVRQEDQELVAKLQQKECALQEAHV